MRYPERLGGEGKPALACADTHELGSTGPLHARTRLAARIEGKDVRATRSPKGVHKPLFIPDQARIVRRLLEPHLGAMPMDNVQIRRDALGVSSCQVAGIVASRSRLKD